MGGMGPMGGAVGGAIPGAPAPRFTDIFGTGLGTYNLQFKTPAERTDYYLSTYNPHRGNYSMGGPPGGGINNNQWKLGKANSDAADARIKTQYAAQINSPTYNRTGQIVNQNAPATAGATTVSGAAPVGAGSTAPAAGSTPKNNKSGGSGPMAAQNDTQLLGKNTLLGS